MVPLPCHLSLSLSLSLPLLFQEVLTNMTIHLNKVVRDQQFFRARESRHRHTLEGNRRRVTWWSLSGCVVVVSVGILQVVLIRNLFKSRRTDKIRT